MNIKCPFINLCKSCKGKCCLYKTFTDQDFSKCKEIGLCPNLYLCEDALVGDLEWKASCSNLIPNLEDIDNINYNVNIPFYRFKSKFIPRVEVYGKNSKEQMEVIKKLGVQTIAVSLSRMISNKENQILKKSFECNLHDRFQFEGKILLQTNIPDSYCIKIMEKYKEFKKALKILNPDIITTYDANFYTDQPIFASIIQWFNVLRANINIKDIKIPQIFLLPPISSFLFKSIFQIFLKSNHRTACVPLGDFRNSETTHILNIINVINHFREDSEKKFEILLISKSPDKRVFADCYSSNTWAKKNGLRKMEKELNKTIKRAKDIKFQRSLLSFFRKRD